MHQILELYTHSVLAPLPARIKTDTMWNGEKLWETVRDNDKVICCTHSILVPVTHKVKIDTMRKGEKQSILVHISDMFVNMFVRLTVTW